MAYHLNVLPDASFCIEYPNNFNVETTFSPILQIKQTLKFVIMGVVSVFFLPELEQKYVRYV